MSFVYLASPYSHIKPTIRDERYRKVLYALHLLAAEGVVAYSPIAHWHNVALHFKLPGDATFWAKQNRGMLRSAERLLVLRIPGWDCSRGVREEIRWAKEFEKPVAPFFLER